MQEWEERILERQEAYEEGEASGEAIGLAKGEARTLVKTVMSVMKKQNLTEAEACELLGFTIEKYREACEITRESEELCEA